MRSLTQESWLALFLIILLCTGLIGTFAGYSVGGIDYSYDPAEPGLTDIITWMWSSGLFLFNIVTMQVDECPIFVSAIFQFISLMTMFILIKIVRGGGG